MRRGLGIAWIGGLLALAGCPAEPYADTGRPPPAASKPAAAAEVTPAPSPAAQPDRGPQFVPPGEGPADMVILAAQAEAAREDRRLVVYVGADWCEPCVAFHQAVERGDFDDELAGVRFLDFDSDRDRGRLRTAGYGGRYIPRFVLPGADGRGTERRAEGGIKGPGAVASIMERLRPLLAPSPGRPEAGGERPLAPSSG